MSGHVTELLDSYLLGELDERAAAHVRAHAESCWMCRKELSDARAVMDVLPQALEPIAPPQRVRDYIFAAIAHDAPAARPPRSRITSALAAGLALALIGNGFLGYELARRSNGNDGSHVVASAPVALVRTAAPAIPIRAALAKIPLPLATRAFVRTPSPIAVLPAVAPAALTATLIPPQLPAGDAEALRRRDRAIDALRALATQDAGRIAQLRHRLELEASHSASRETPLVAALATGRVYSINGTVGGEAWQGTVLQATPTSNAVLVTRAPEASAGSTFHVWVLRNQRSYDIGALASHTDTTLEMPMPLRAGDVVAFSQETESASGMPAQTYLMELPITK